MKIAPLSTPECLAIHRRRNGLSQVAYARELRISLDAYRQIETGVTQLTFFNLKRKLNIQPPKVMPLKQYEICFVLRRRSGLTIGQLSARCGLGSWLITQIERGRENAAPLFHYWNKACRTSRNTKRTKGT